MEKLKLMTDMDDVITTGGFLRLINEFLDTNYTEENVSGYFQQELIPKDKLNDFFSFFKTKNMYDYCELTDGVVEVLEELNHYYDVYVGTSYLFKEIKDESGFVLLNKFNFLVKNFPFLDPYKFVFSGDKSVLQFDIKIDDRIDNLINTQRKILFTAYHNKDLEDFNLEKQNIERAKDWYDVKRKLLKK